MAVGPLASAWGTFSLVGLFPPALDAAPHGSQQAGLHGVVGQRLHHTRTYRQGQCQGTLWSEGVGRGHQCVSLLLAASPLVSIIMLLRHCKLNQSQIEPVSQLSFQVLRSDTLGLPLTSQILLSVNPLGSAFRLCPEIAIWAPPAHLKASITTSIITLQSSLNISGSSLHLQNNLSRALPCRMTASLLDP